MYVLDTAELKVRHVTSRRDAWSSDSPNTFLCGKASLSTRWAFCTANVAVEPSLRPTWILSPGFSSFSR